MPTPSALIKGIVQRWLPTPSTLSGPEAERVARSGVFGDLKVESAWPSDHLLCDEGAYMSAAMTSGQVALQNGILAAYSATQATVVLYNSAPQGNGPILFLKYLRLGVSTVPTSGTNLRYSLGLSNFKRTPTVVSNAAGGTGPGTAANNTAYQATSVCNNQNLNPAIFGQAFFPFGLTGSTGAATVPADPNLRTIVGNGFVKNTAPVVFDQYIIQFGGVDPGGTVQGASAAAKIVEAAPAVAIGPGQTATILLWSASNITAGIAFDDLSLGWIER